jgi:hypothetical protein
MKFLVSILVATVGLVWLTPEPAEARGRSYRTKRAPTYYRSYQRPASVGSNGLCQRDTGTPTSQLNFRNKCDTEEFWNRMNGRGGFGRR